jgi:hypothetical protein
MRPGGNHTSREEFQKCSPELSEYLEIVEEIVGAGRKSVGDAKAVLSIGSAPMASSLWCGALEKFDP